MGAFNVTIRIGDLGGTRFEEFEAMADTGATTTVVPGTVMNCLGIRPTRRETFEYAGGERVEITIDVQDGRQAFDEGLKTLEWFGCPVYYPWK